ncbi:MAG: flagellar assembly protein FliH [Rhodanobacter sp.]|nr:MAG: flagellar assembly protein FliH [Rhodanobacter sp.]
MISANSEAGSSIQRWELPQVGHGRPAAKTAGATVQPTVSEIEAISQQAYDEGYAAGHAQGLAAAQQQLRDQLVRFDVLYEAAARPLQTLDEQTELELARLAVAVARRVIGHELRLSPELIVKAVRQAVSALPASTRELRVYVHPDDLRLLEGPAASDAHWKLFADPLLARGDCRLESERSRLDARVETRLAAVVDAVFTEDERVPEVVSE